MRTSTPGEGVVSRTVRVLDAFTPEAPALTVSDVARRTGIPLATTSRLVAELVRHGLLARTTDRRVRVGVRLWELGLRASPTLTLREVAMPFLQDVHAVVGHHVQLGVLEGDEVLFLERLSAPDAVVNYTRIAGRLPLHVSSSGLVLLAHGPVDLQETVLAGPLRRYTERTITTPARLRRVLAEVRRDGWVACPGYVHEDALGVAVPVRGPRGGVVAAVAAVVPVDHPQRALVPVLVAAARGISRTIGQGAPTTASDRTPAE